MSEAAAAAKKKYRPPKGNGKTTAENADGLMQQYTPAILMQFWKNIEERLESGDQKAMALVHKMFYQKDSPAIALQINSGTAVAPQAAEDTPRFRSFEQIVRKINAAKDTPQLSAQAAPAPSAAIQEAEFVDVPDNPATN